MDQRTWAYGPNGESQIFDCPDDVPNGWKDSPAAFSGKAEKAPETNPEADDFLATLSDMPDKDAKLALDKWADEEHGIKLNRRYTLENMLKQFEEALNGDGH